ncbi:MAG TPA: HepT-like ribonuclease domain-containing protein [Candidatus Nanoarchaeia archaeon]|nr:HepT-like ribonuclease domain-containing protein [Candidatus Nanoarchaeia archaeon]
MIDSRISQKIKEIEENIELIRDNLPEEMEEFSELGLVKDGIYKRLEYSLQNLVDIFSIIYSSLNLGVPSSIDEIFASLVKKKIFPKKIIDLVQEMKGLRNILVHKYGQIDDERIFNLLRERLDDFGKVISAVEEHLKKEKNKK